MENLRIGNMGWTCPTCGYSYAPSMVSCLNCNRPEHEKYTISTTTQPKSNKKDKK